MGDSGMGHAFLPGMSNAGPENTNKGETMKLEIGCTPNALRLRHRVFAELLHWVPEMTSGLDTDQYDALSTTFSMVEGDAVYATVRLNCGPSRVYMLSHEFYHLCPREFEETGAEMTRLCLNPDITLSPIQRKTILLSLLHVVYEFTVREGVTHIYAVMEERMLRFVQSLGFLFKVLHSKSGIVSAVLDISELEQSTKPHFKTWFHNKAVKL